jgi:hypothetical protein
VKAPKLAPEQVELVRARAETALGDSGSAEARSFVTRLVDGGPKAR